MRSLSLLCHVSVSCNSVIVFVLLFIIRVVLVVLLTPDSNFAFYSTPIFLSVSFKAISFSVLPIGGHFVCWQKKKERERESNCSALSL